MNILQLHIDKAKLTPELLDWVTNPSNGMGKKTDKFWIFKSDVNVRNDAQSPFPSVEVFNQLCAMANMKGFESLMISK